MKTIKLIPLAIGLMLGSAQADSIAITNHSFETTAVAVGTFNGLVSGWTDIGATNDNGVFRGNGDFNQTAAPTDGLNMAFINDVRTVALVQTVAATFQTGVDYELKVDITSRAAPIDLADGATLVLYTGSIANLAGLTAANTVATLFLNSASGLLTDDFETFTLTATAAQVDAVSGAGQTIGIGIIGGPLTGTDLNRSQNYDLDNVRLDSLSYAVTFDSNGGSAVASQQVNLNGTATTPTDPTRTGYTFGGWFTDNGTFLNAYNFATPVTGAVALFAKWTINNYTVSYDGNTSDGGSAPATQNGNYNTTITAAANTFTKTGNAFFQWNTVPGGGGTAVNADASFTIPASNTTLYAQWTAVAVPTKLVVTVVPTGTTLAGDTFSVTVQAQSAGGAPGQVSSNTGISLAASGAGTLAGNTATINAGSAVVTLTGVTYTKAQAITLTASVTSGPALTTSVASSSFTVSPNVVSVANSTAVANPASLAADGSAAATVTVTLKDAYNNLLAGTNVTWSVAGTGNNVTPASAGTTDGSGVASFTVKSVKAEAKTVTVNVGATVITDSLQITFTPTGSPNVLTWDPANNTTGSDGDGTWSTSTANWAINSTDFTWPNSGNDAAVFGSGAALAADYAVTMGTPVTVGNLTFNTTDTNQYTLGNQQTITLAGTPTISVAGAATIAGPLAGTGFSKTGAGTLTLSGASTYTGDTTISTGTLMIGGAGQLGGGSYLGNITNDAIFDYSSSLVQTLSGQISGAGQLTKNTGTGTLTLGGNNSYDGVTTVNAGILAITHSNALGTTVGATTINGANGSGGVALSLSSATTDLTIAENLNFFGNAAGRAKLELTNPAALTHTLSGDIDVSSATSIPQWTSGGTGSLAVLKITGDITGTFGGTADNLLIRGNPFGTGGSNPINTIEGNVTLVGGGISKTDGGTWQIGASGKTYTAPVLTSFNGLLLMGSANYLDTATPVRLDTGGNSTFDLNGFSQTVEGINNLTGGGTRLVTNTGAAAVLTVNNATDYTAAALTGNISLVKDGVGTQTLGAVNTYTGNTTVSNGMLTLSQADSETDANTGNDASTVTISNNGTSFLNLTYTGTDVVNSLVIGVTPQAPGVYGQLLPVVPGVTGIAQITGPGTLSVGGGFSSWITSTFTNGQVPEGQRGANQDPDNDGIPNLVEYAVKDEDPTVSKATVGTYTPTSLSFDKRLPLATDITYAIQESTDLGLIDTWAQVVDSPPTNPYVNDPTTISYAFTPGTPAKDFFRLQVTQP